jgi:hypothetical protein
MQKKYRDFQFEFVALILLDVGGIGNRLLPALDIIG